MSDDTLTSFDAFAHEHNLSGHPLEIARLAFKLGRKIERKEQIKPGASPMSDSDNMPLQEQPRP